MTKNIFSNNTGKTRLIFVAIFVLLIGLYFAVIIYQNSLLKTSFGRVDKDVDELMLRISAKDPELAPRKLKYCRNDTVVYGSGRKSCYIDIIFASIASSSIQSAELAIGGAVKQAKMFEPVKDKSLNLDPKDQALNSYTNTSTQMSCSFSSNIINRSQQDENYQILVRFSCGKYVDRAIY